jgi:hypothetical protein
MPEEKTCRQCNTPKSLNQFYVHSGMVDGHLNKCIDCVKARVKARAHADPERERLAAREKARRPKYRELNAAWRIANPKRVAAIKARWGKNNSEKRYAHTLVQRALQSGKIVKASHCEHESGCSVTDGLEAHHEDYSRPLDVKWLCSTHHGVTRHK